ncbi:unnamed protein product [Rodentolepis nana]|uniref:Orange domain-containing protein n=1 Tax=Rodentolepis nana TaxID=102285 RepID=A0A0R3TEM5_RODNA|nr:unnamed protein product [Rodentolepis nana]
MKASIRREFQTSMCDDLKARTNEKRCTVAHSEITDDISKYLHRLGESTQSTCILRILQEKIEMIHLIRCPAKMIKTKTARYWEEAGHQIRESDGSSPFPPVGFTSGGSSPFPPVGYRSDGSSPFPHVGYIWWVFSVSSCFTSGGSSPFPPVGYRSDGSSPFPHVGYIWWVFSVSSYTESGGSSPFPPLNTESGGSSPFSPVENQMGLLHFLLLHMVGLLRFLL